MAVVAARRFIWSMVAAQGMVQIGAFTLPALLPGYIDRWHLTKTEAGWLIGVFFAAYVVAVPALVSLTDRIPTRKVYAIGAGLTALSHLGFAFIADGFWSALILRAVAGVGWAGAYMPGLKAIADTLEGNAQSRAVSLHAAGVGVAGASSYAVAGLIDTAAGPSAAFAFGGLSALIALLLAWRVMPKGPPKHSSSDRSLLDFRPVFRNRRAMAWIAGYTVHTWEMAAVRAWGCHVSDHHRRAGRITVLVARADNPADRGRPDRHCRISLRQRKRAALRTNARGDGCNDDRIGSGSMHGLVPRRVHDRRRRAHCSVGRCNILGQLRAHCRDSSGVGSRIARSHDGASQHVRICGRLHRSAWGRPLPGFCRQQPDAWLGAWFWTFGSRDIGRFCYTSLVCCFVRKRIGPHLRPKRIYGSPNHLFPQIHLIV